tara:strand:+ start:3368 stop:3937 length:570 start_codon:yes stop_codon:yes gene_type:complete
MGIFNFLNKRDKKSTEITPVFSSKYKLEKITKYSAVPKEIENHIATIKAISINKEKNIEVKVDELLKIYESLSDDQKRRREGRFIIICIGEICFAERMIEEAFENFNFALKFKDTIGNPFIHLRMGQLNYLVQNKDKTLDELSRALIMGGEEVYEHEDPRFLEMVKNVLKEPNDCSWEEYEGQDWTDTK